MEKRILARLCGLACMLTLLAVPALGMAKITMKIGHGAPESTAVHAGWLHFKKLIEERSKGEFVIQLYGNQQLWNVYKFQRSGSHYERP